MSFSEHPAATPTFAETINVDDHKVLQSDREYIVQLDGSISGQWIELLRESATSVLAEGPGLTLDLKTFALSTVKDLRLSRP